MPDVKSFPIITGDWQSGTFLLALVVSFDVVKAVLEEEATHFLPISLGYSHNAFIWIIGCSNCEKELAFTK